MNKPELDFLKSHPTYAFRTISGFYPLTGEMLRKYRNVLFWDCICENESIDWSSGLILAFLKYFKEDNKKINSLLHFNPKLPWSVEFIKQFETLWYWDILGEKAEIKNSAEIQQSFKKYLEPVNAWIASNDLRAKTHDSDKFWKKRYQAEPWLLYTTRHQIESDKKIDWVSLSSSDHLKWTHDFIRDYQDKLNWQALSCNTSIHWTNEMIFEFQDKIFWGGLEVTFNKQGKEKTFIDPGFTIFSNKCWTPDEIELFHDKIDWYTLSINENSCQWSYNLLTTHEKFIDFDALGGNRQAWVDCFGKLTDEEVESILANKEMQSKVEYPKEPEYEDEEEASHSRIPFCMTFEYFLMKQKQITT